MTDVAGGLPARFMLIQVLNNWSYSCRPFDATERSNFEECSNPTTAKCTFRLSGPPVRT